MPRIKSFSPKLNLDSYDTFIVDSNESSFYFKITDFKETFTGGKNGFLIEGSTHLKESTDLQIEVLDVNGDPVYHEPGDGLPEYYEGTSKLVSTHIYEDTPIGEGKITIFGELKTFINDLGEVEEVPDEWKGTYNVKWTRRFKINQRLPNEDKVRFYQRPRVTITELSGSLFSREFESTTVSGSLRGIPIQPDAGTPLSRFPGSTFYKLRTTDGTLFDQDMLRNGIVDIPSLSFKQPIDELFADNELIVREPYVVNGEVASFPSSNYELTYDKVSQLTESSILASFARFKIDRLSTFVGDVARLKVFSKPAESISDYEVIEDIFLESTELLVTQESGSNIPYGVFKPNYQDNWDVPTTTGYTVTQTNERIFGGLKIDSVASSPDPQRISTDEQLPLSGDTEYTLNFDVVFEGNITDDDRVNVFLEYENDLSITLRERIVNFKPTEILKNKQTISRNVITELTTDHRIIFEVTGGVGNSWHIGDISFRSSQETSFSPDDIQLTIPVERNLEVETLDFKFEFFDINNNYIPVDVFTNKTFRLGNINTIDKSITPNITPRPFFQFDTDGFANPEDQTIRIRLKKNRIIGDLQITRTVFDFNGDPIDENDYIASGGVGTEYPGTLVTQSISQSENEYTLPIANFTGSLHDNPPNSGSIIIGSIQYDVLENPNQTGAPADTTFTIFRQDVGESSKQLQVSSDKNQFTYKRTDLRPVPNDQEIVITVNRSNLPTLDPLDISKVGGGPFLSASVPQETEQYFLSASVNDSPDYFYQGDGTTRYTFSVEDLRGVPFSGSVKIDPVVLDEPANVRLSQETHTFNARSTGELIDDISGSNTEVTVQVGADDIEYDASLSNNTWRISTYNVSGGSPLTPTTSGDLLTRTIGLSTFPDGNDEATIDLVVEYKDGLGEIETVHRVINFSKAKIAAPVLNPVIIPRNQTVNSLSTGEQTDNFEDVTVQIDERYEGQSTTLSIQNASATSRNSKLRNTPTGTTQVSNVNVSGVPGQTVTVDLNGLYIGQSFNNNIIDLSFEVIDSEGTTRQVTDTLSLSKSKNAQPSVVIESEPQIQAITVDPNGNPYDTLSNVSVFVREGGTDILTGQLNVVSYFGFSQEPSSSVNVLELGATGQTAFFTGSKGEIVVEADYTDSEGTSGTLSTTIETVKQFEGDQGIQGTVVDVTPSSQTLRGNITPQGVDWELGEEFEVRVSEGDLPYAYEHGQTNFNLLPAPGFTIINLTNGTFTSGTGGGSVAGITPETGSLPQSSVTTFDVVYKNSLGDISNPIEYLHRVNGTLDGNTGPGVVMTGVWEEGRVYQGIDDPNDPNSFGTRRDVVLWSDDGQKPYDTYYSANVSHTGSISNQPPDVITWQTLGKQDFFVAAKVAIFEESFIQNTLNIGTNNNGGVSSANITLWGGDQYPYFSLGQASATGSQGYATGGGIFIGRDTDNEFKISVESSLTNNSLLWNGSNLIVSGSLFTEDANIGGFIIDSGSIRSVGNEIVLNSDGSGHLADQNVTWNVTGDITVDGTIVAESGSLNNLDIIGTLTFQQNGRLRMISGSEETVRMSQNEPIPLAGELIDEYTTSLPDVEFTGSSEQFSGNRKSDTVYAFTVPNPNDSVEVVFDFDTNTVNNSFTDFGTHIFILENQSGQFNSWVELDRYQYPDPNIAANDPSASLNDIAIGTEFAQVSNFRVRYQHTWNSSATVFEATFTNGTTTQYNPITVINSKGIFVRFTPNIVKTVGGGGGVSSGGSFSSVNWNNIIDKPFTSIGTNLEVISGSLNVVDSPSFAGNVTVSGNLTVNGTQFITNTETVEIEDNLAIINNGETGAGVTEGFSGWQIDRGTETDFLFGFQESNSAFSVGTSGSVLQAIATREDTPTSNGVPRWNSTSNRFETSTNLTFDGSNLEQDGGYFWVKSGVSYLSGGAIVGSSAVPTYDFEVDGNSHLKTGWLWVEDNYILAGNKIGVGEAPFGPNRLGNSDLQTPSVDLRTINFKDSASTNPDATAIAIFTQPVGASDGYVTSIKNFTDDVNVVSISSNAGTADGAVGREVESTIGLRNDFSGGEFSVFDMFNQDYDASTDVASKQGFVAIHGGGKTKKNIGLWRYDTTTYTNIFEVDSNDTFNLGVAVTVSGTLDTTDNIYSGNILTAQNGIEGYGYFYNLGGGTFDSTLNVAGATTLSSTLDVSGLAGFGSNVESIGTNGFTITTDFNGTGYQITDDGDMNIRNLIVREAARFRELIIDQLSAVGGSFIYSAARGKVSGSNGNTITLEDPNGKGVSQFAENDIFVVRTVDIDGGEITYVTGRVSGVTNPGSGSVGPTLTLTQSGLPDASGSIASISSGDVIVQRGNTLNTARQDLIYISATDTDSPVEKFFSGVDSISAFSDPSKIITQVGRLGNLPNIPFGTEGFYGSNMFLTESVLVGDLTKNGSYMEFDNGNMTVVADSIDFRSGNISNTFILTDQPVAPTQDHGGFTKGLFFGDIQEPIFDPNNINQSGIFLGVDKNFNERFVVGNNTVGDLFDFTVNGALTLRIENGDVTIGDVFSIDSSTNSGSIAGWNFDSERLYNSANTIEANVSSNRFRVAEANVDTNTSNFVEMYQTSTTDWGILGVKDSTTVFQLGETNKIAGWEFSSSRLTRTGKSVSIISEGITGIRYKGAFSTPSVTGFVLNNNNFMIEDSADSYFQIGSSTEWVAYDTTNGLDIKTTDLTIQNGSADFSGTLSAPTGSLGDLNVSGSLTLGTGGEMTNPNGDFTISEFGMEFAGDSTGGLHTSSREIKFVNPTQSTETYIGITSALPNDGFYIRSTDNKIVFAPVQGGNQGLVQVRGDLTANSIGTSGGNIGGTLDTNDVIVGGDRLQIPVLTQTERDNLTSPTDGLIILNSSTNDINFYIAGAWRNT